MMKVVKTRLTHPVDVIDSSASPLLPYYLSLHRRAQRDKDPEQWLIGRATTPTEYNSYIKQTIASPDVRENRFFTHWSNELIQKDVDIDIKQMLVQMKIEERLRLNGGTYTGSFNALTLSEVIFISQAIRIFRNITDIFAVDELGYTDIWLVFPDFGEVESLERIEKCCEIINKHGLHYISYLTLHPGNFTEDVPAPLLHITIGGS